MRSEPSWARRRRTATRTTPTTASGRLLGLRGLRRRAPAGPGSGPWGADGRGCRGDRRGGQAATGGRRVRVNHQRRVGVVRDGDRGVLHRAGPSPRVARFGSTPSGAAAPSARRVCYATVHEHREGKLVIAMERVQIFGTAEGLEAALGESTVSRAVNTSFLERQNGTDRGRDARKSRKTYRVGKDWEVHEALTYLTMYGYNFPGVFGR